MLLCSNLIRCFQFSCKKNEETNNLDFRTGYYMAKTSEHTI